MKRLLLLIFLITSVGLYSQEFDGTYKVTKLSVVGGDCEPMTTKKVKWYAIIKGDTVTIYNSKKLNSVFDTYIIGKSIKGDLIRRAVLNEPPVQGGEYILDVSSVDDFTKRVTNMVYLMRKQ